MASDDAEEEYDEEAGEDGSDRWDIRLIPGIHMDYATHVYFF